MADSLTYSQKLVGQPGWSGNNLIDRLARALGQGLGQAGLGGGFPVCLNPEINFRKCEKSCCVGWDNWVCSPAK